MGKKTVKKKWVANGICGLILTVIFVIIAALIPKQETQAATLTDGDYQYTVDENGNATLMKYTGSDAVVTIPDKVTDGKTEYPVIGIGYDTTTFLGAFEANASIQEVIIPAGIEMVGEDAFAGCTSLKLITFDETSRLKTLGKWAFEGTAVEEVVIPASVETMIGSAFMNCERLKTVIFAEGSILKTIGGNSFENTAIEQIEIPASVETIGTYAFLFCRQLVDLTFAEGSMLKEIGRSAFGDTKIKEIVLPSGLTTLDESPFLRVSSLKTIYYPSVLENQVDKLVDTLSLQYRAAYTILETTPAMVSITYYDIADNVTNITVPDIICGMEVASIKAGDVEEPDSQITVANTVKKLSQVKLPDGWSFATEDLEKEINAGDSVTVNVTYQGAISYSKEIFKEITVTRENCNMQILFTGAGEKTPTCSENGSGHEECSICGEVGQKVAVAATGIHLYTETRGKKEATCKEQGYTGDTYCADYNNLVSTGNVIPKNANHLWDAGNITKEATETAKGEKTFTCTMCGVTQTEEIPIIAITTVPKTEKKKEEVFETEEFADTENETGEIPDDGPEAERIPTVEEELLEVKEQEKEEGTQPETEEVLILGPEKEEESKFGFNLWFVIIPATAVVAAVGLWVVLRKKNIQKE